MRASFLGAARIVTGSCFLFEAGSDKVLVDCGMFQGSKDVNRLNYEAFSFDPSRITALVLTHAHIDHSGLVPLLAREGFEGPIWCTAPTRDLCEIMLEDSAWVHAKDTEHENKRRAREHLAPREPLYSVEDAKACMRQFRTVPYDEEVALSRSLGFRLLDAGHILGSAIVELSATEGRHRTKVVCSGDLGERNAAIVPDPTPVTEADHVLIESTYGDRLHEGVPDRLRTLAGILNETCGRGGRVMVPSFAVERTQELIYAMNLLIREDRMPDVRVFLDSPLAIKATNIFSRYKDWFDPDAMALFDEPFHFKRLVFTPDVEDSMRLNDLSEPCVVIAGNGMCSAGRIRHHLRHGIGNPRNAVLFVGYQAEGTLGKHILNGAERIKMMGLELEVKARVHRIEAFSAHADYDDLVHWATGFTPRRPKRVFVVHGEPASADALCSKLSAAGLACSAPGMGERAEL